MGRYYSGDVEGQFYPGLQSSNAAGRFGSFGKEPSYIEYYFDESHLDLIKEELAAIKKDLGKNFKKAKAYFNDGNVEKTVKDFFPDLDEYDVRYILREYSDYELGCKIRDCVIEKGECSFQAEY